MSALDALMTPRSVAIIGASDDVTRIGGLPIAAMRQAGFAGTILPANPKRDIVQGLPCYGSIDDLPQAPDAAIITVAAKFVLSSIEALGRKGCKVVTLFSSGFAEAGDAGEAAEREMLAMARKYGMRVLGLNALGVYNVDAGYYGTFSSFLDSGYPLPGKIGIASQSGAFGAHLTALARDRGLGCSVFIATGNECDLTLADAILWMVQNDKTDVICAYMEGITDGPALLHALDAARAAGKPVLAMKSGRSAVGARGTQPADIEALSAMLSKLSVFAAGAGDRLMSIDLNPVLAMPSGQGAYALDAVIELVPEKA